MQKQKNGEFRSKVYTDRPPYADFDAAHKFEAIKSIVARRLYEHPNAICSYSGGSDSDMSATRISGGTRTIMASVIRMRMRCTA